MSKTKKYSSALKDNKKWMGWYHLIKNWWYLPLLAIAAYWFFSPTPPPTIEEYVAATDGRAKVITSGILNLNGTKMSCDKFPIVLDDKFEDHAAAWPQTGFIIVNRRYMDPLPKVQQLFTFHHECGHMKGQTSELDADCFSIKRGRKLGWLDQKGLDQLCAYWRPKKGDATHPPGPVRCEHMIACFNE